MAPPDDGIDFPDDGFDQDIAILIDNGSWMAKAGLSCDKGPRSVFPEVVGKPRRAWRDSVDKEYYYGDEVLELANKLAIFTPLENGIIENFDYMELLWGYTFFDQLKVNPSKHAVLLTEPPYNPRANRERMVEIMFEVFGVPALNVSVQGVLALIGQGFTTGLVLDSGEGVTHTVPVVEGFGMCHCINRLDFAGRELNTLLAKLLAREGCCLTTTAQQHHVRLMKESHCYVAQNPKTEVAESVAYTMPDGAQIQLSNERWLCPEALFSPHMAGLESMGVAGLVWESISNCAIDNRKALLSNVALAGASTMFPGFRERLVRDLKSHAPAASQASIRVLRSVEAKHAVWLGALVSAGLRGMQEHLWMKIDDYEEHGAGYIHDKIAVRYD